MEDDTRRDEVDGVPIFSAWRMHDHEAAVLLLKAGMDEWF